MTNVTPAIGLSAYFLGRRIAGQRKRQPIAYQYNGVRLPPLPVWDTEAYPYAVLSYFESTGVATLHVFNKPVGISTRGTGFYAMDYLVAENDEDFSLMYGDLQAYGGVKVDNFAFTYSEENRPSSSYFFPKYDVLWANYNVIDYDKNELIISASEPVPIYE